MGSENVYTDTRSKKIFAYKLKLYYLWEKIDFEKLVIFHGISLVLCSVLSLEIRPESIGGRMLLLFNSCCWGGLLRGGRSRGFVGNPICNWIQYIFVKLGKLDNSFVIFGDNWIIFGNISNPLLGKMDDSFVTSGDK